MKQSIIYCTLLLCLVFTTINTQAQLKGDELLSLEKSSYTFNANLEKSSLKLPEKEVRKWQNLKFGMFIHWGLYSIVGKGEWWMFNEKISVEEYAKLAQQFNPQKFDATKWATIAQHAGMKYMVLTTRHHDGFALWKSRSSYNHFNSYETAAKRDFVAEYTKACRKAGLKVGIYYSPMDWRFPGYFRPNQLTANAALMKKQGYEQVKELMKNYGKIDILWYDGGWLAHKGTDADAAWFWEPKKLNSFVRDLQPNVMINPRSGIDGNFVCNEGGSPVKGAIVNRAWEKCLTLNRYSWGYNFKTNNMTPAEVLNMLVNTVDRGGNMLLNVGPDANGEIPQEQVAILEKVGNWLKTYGESIYDTQAGPFQPVDNYYGSVFNDNKIYLHLLRNEKTLVLPAIAKTIVSCAQLNGKSLSFTQNETGIVIDTDKLTPDEEIITLVLECKR